jgi:hypothetical protein
VRGAVVIGLAVLLGIIGLQILDDSNDGPDDATVMTTPGAASDGSSTTTAGAPLRENQDVRVKVYNASGVPGKAQTLTDTLSAKGYNMQTPANLGRQRAGTVVQCQSGFTAEGDLLSFLHVPASTVQAFPSDPPEGASDADCLVIVGTA